MAQNAILAENTQSTVFLEAYGVFGFVMQFGGELPEFPLALGDECVVVWDGIEYNVTVGDSSAFMAGTKYVGNGAAFGLAGNNEPFVIAWDGAGATFVSFTDTAPTSHTIAIYQAVEDEPQEEVGIVIKNYSGIPIEYKGVEKVMFNTADGGKRVYSKGEALEDVSIELDFSSGDMTVKSAEGTLVKSAVIKKPDTLVAENIAEGIDIAGIIGTLSAGSGMAQGVEYILNDNDEIIEAKLHGMNYVPAYCFYYISTLKTIDFSNSPNITDIGMYAFCGCSSLTSITIPAGVEKIPQAAFSGCSSLTSIVVPDGVTSIGDNAFYGCSGLTSIVIPDGVTSIGKSAFIMCAGLTSVTIPASVKKIGQYAFNGSGLTSAKFNDTSGWYCSSSETATSGTNLKASDLANTSTAATYLTSDHMREYWFDKT